MVTGLRSWRPRINISAHSTAWALMVFGIATAVGAGANADLDACAGALDRGEFAQAAKAGEMAGLGVARLIDQALLNEAGADLVVTSLDDVAVKALSEGRLDRATIH